MDISDNLIPEVTVFLSAYNNIYFIEEQVESILSQREVKVFLIIRVDGSFDGTAEFLKIKYSNLDNIKIIIGQNLGPAMSFMKLLELSDFHTEYYCFSDADDYWLPNKLKDSIYKLKNESADAVVVRYEIVDENLNYLSFSKPPRKSYSFNNALVECVTPGNATLFNYKIYNLIKTKFPNYIVMHDAWLYLVLSAFGKITFLDVPLVKYRQHGKNVFGISNTFSKRIKIRMKNIFFPQFSYYNQAFEFSKCFGNILSINDKIILSKYLDYKNSKLNTLFFFLVPSINVQSFHGNILLRILILFRRV
jgi:glycosyltransferase involved in cell wall biosynthesis